jgi:transcription antitermination factor NusG
MSGLRSAAVRGTEIDDAVAFPQSVCALWTEPRWYAVQTAARHEKAVRTQLARREVDTFLPLQVAVHKWGERKVTVELPLFPGYVFAHIPYRERLTVLTANGVLRIVSFNGLPSPVADEEIQTLRSLSVLPSVQPYRFLEAGRRVRISSGALEGLEGIVVKRKNSIRFIVSVQAIQRSLSVEVSAADLRCIQ